MQEKVDNAIEESESLEHFGTLRLDALSQKKDQDRLNMNLRPKFSYENFDGTYSNFGTFIKNAEQIFSFFFRQAQTATCAVVKNHQPRNKKRTSKLQGSQNCTTKALEWLHLRWGNPHLQLPAVYDEIKNLQPAKSQADIPKAAEQILSKIEAWSSLKEDTQPLPSNVTTAIFRALHLSTEEKKEVLPLLERPD